MMNDLSWKRLDEVSVGDRIISVDEEVGGSGVSSSGKALCRRFKVATVEHIERLTKPVLLASLSSGRKLTITAEHRMLFKQRGGCMSLWREMGSAKIGDHIRSAFRPAPEDVGYEDGWFAGIVDGEGNRSSKNESSVSIAISQVDGPVLRRMKAYLDQIGVRYYETIDARESGASSKLGSKPVHRLEIGRMADVAYLMNRCRTSRIRFDGSDIADRKIGGNRTKNGVGKQASWDEIVSIEHLAGETDVIDLQTSEKTFIVDGLVSHNSTYIGERFYHQVSTQGMSAFVVAHEDKATANLYEMVKRYQDHNLLAPSTKATNAKELVFSVLDCGYKLATAGSKNVGRSNTAQLLHGSEFAFWDNAQSHLAGLGNTIADLPNTEIILESTGNGIGNAFHLMWQEAEAGRGDYIAIFVPWFWQEEYRAAVKPDLQLSHEDIKYQQAYELDQEQMQWRANKIATYGQGFEWLFDQEYPATATLAFQSSTVNPLINPSNVMAAVNSKFLDMNAPLVIGCDPAGDGVNDADRTAIAFRRGRVCFRLEYHQGLDTMQIAGKLAEYWRDMEPDGVFIDKGGLGAGVYDRLIELGFPVIGVNNATRATDAERFENKRAEMWWTMNDWFADQPCRIPNNAALISDLTAPQPKVSSNGRKLLEKKEDMVKRQVRSPDGGDALSLTFAEPVAFRSVLSGPSRNPTPSATTAGY